MIILVTTHQFDNFDEHPIVGGRCHEFEEDRGEREVILRILASQFTNDIHSSRLNA